MAEDDELSTMTFFEDVSKLFELELYEDVLALNELTDYQTESNQLKLATLAAIIAESFYQCERYAECQNAFYRAITITKSLPKTSEGLKFGEAELKYRLHRCLLKLRKREEAIGVLGSIAEEEMTPKARSALARLHVMADLREQKGSLAIGNSLIYHKKVVDNCPEAFYSLSCILRGGIRVNDISRWSSTVQAWLKAQVATAEQNFMEAVKILEAIPANHLRIVLELGRLYYLLGENQKAEIQLQRAHHMDPGCSHSMDILAYILAQNQKFKELENLAGSLMDAQESVEAWITYAFLAKCYKRHDKALHFVQKACSLTDWQVHPMTMLLKALILMDKRKFDEAVEHLRDALIFHPKNFDLYEALVKAYTLQNKMHEARLVACSCKHNLGQENARALYLCAMLAAKEETTIKDAQKLLEKAIHLSPHLLNAVFLLVDLYDRTQNYDKAIALLKKQAEVDDTIMTVNSRLHRLLGDFLSKTNRPVDACNQYRLAVDGDGNAVQAMNALEGMPGMITPECLASSICPGAPRKRALAQAEPNPGERNP